MNMPDVLKKTLLSRRFIALVLLGVLSMYKEKLGIPEEAFATIEKSIWLWVGVETARSSVDGSGLFELIKIMLENKKIDKDAKA
jgi:hypothetical protein